MLLVIAIGKKTQSHVLFFVIPAPITVPVRKQMCCWFLHFILFSPRKTEFVGHGRNNVPTSSLVNMNIFLITSFLAGTSDFLDFWAE